MTKYAIFPAAALALALITPTTALADDGADQSGAQQTQAQSSCLKKQNGFVWNVCLQGKSFRKAEPGAAAAGVPGPQPDEPRRNRFERAPGEELDGGGNGGR